MNHYERAMAYSDAMTAIDKAIEATTKWLEAESDTAIEKKNLDQANRVAAARDELSSLFNSVRNMVLDVQFYSSDAPVEAAE